MIHRFVIAASHPCLPGHFPGRPIVPAVVLLEQVFACYEQVHGRRPCGLTQAKFVQPVLPEQTVELSFVGPQRFECRVGEQLVLSGQLAEG